MEARDAQAIIRALVDIETERTGRPQLYDFVYEITEAPDAMVRGRVVDSQGSVLVIGEMIDDGTRNREIAWDSIEHIAITTDDFL